MADFDTSAAPTVDTLDEFEEDTEIDVQDMLADAMMDEDGAPREKDEYDIIRAYKEGLYNELPEADYEDDKIKMDHYDELVSAAGNELITSVTQRRDGSLEFAIDTFNKI